MKLHDQLSIDLGEIEQALLAVIDTDSDLEKPSVFYDGIRDLIDSGGKRVRPMLVLVGGRFGKPRMVSADDLKSKLLRIAAMLEYLHMASLVHDDVIDQADLRRGSETLHRKTDPRTAVHLANYMMARAVEWATAGEDEAERSAELAALVTQLCRGEYQQLDTRFRFDLTLDAYLDKTRNKTAVLIVACLKAGAEAAGADARTIAALERFGDALGVAFQIRDDVLDFLQTADVLGKPAGSDLRSGNVTLPVLYALEDPQLAGKILALGPDSTEDAFADAVASIAASDSITRSMGLCDLYAAKALAEINALVEYPAAADLEVLLRYFVLRDK